MKARSLLLIVGLSIAGVLAVSTPAAAKPLDKGHLNEVSAEDFLCDTVSPPIPTHRDTHLQINFTLNQRGGPNVFPYFRESVSGTDVYTHEGSDGTYTDVFTRNSRDHKIVDNGDGTITIVAQGSGVDRWYDTNGRLVLVDSGNFRYSFDIDYKGTPGNVNDDVEVPDSFQVVRDSTGRNIVDRNFCEDLLEFAT